MPARSWFTLSVGVKFIGIISALNVLLTVFSLSAWRRNSTLTHEVKRQLELSRYPHERLPFDVVLGAPLIELDSDILLERLRYGSQSLQIKRIKNEDEMRKQEHTHTNLFLCVRTTKSYHKSRMKILLDTWIPKAKDMTTIFTDSNDDWLMDYASKKGLNSKERVVVTDCPLSYEHKWALLCKFYWAYRRFLSTPKDWFCHFDDDTYVNIEMLLKVLSTYSPNEKLYIGRSPSKKPIVQTAYDTENYKPPVYSLINSTMPDNETFGMPEARETYRRIAFHFALGGAGYCLSRQLVLEMKQHALGSRLLHSAASISLPDDCIIGYVITHLLNVSLISTDLFHTHLEDLSTIPESLISEQITLSYDIINSTSRNGRQIQPQERRNVENSKFFNETLSALHGISNVISISGRYTTASDPTRFYSVHQLITNGSG